MRKKDIEKKAEREVKEMDKIEKVLTKDFRHLIPEFLKDESVEIKKEALRLF